MSVEISNDMLSPTQAANQLGVSSARIRQMVSEGKLPAVMTPLGRLIPADAVEAMRREREAAKSVA